MGVRISQPIRVNISKRCKNQFNRLPPAGRGRKGPFPGIFGELRYILHIIAYPGGKEKNHSAFCLKKAPRYDILNLTEPARKHWALGLLSPLSGGWGLLLSAGLRFYSFPLPCAGCIPLFSIVGEGLAPPESLPPRGRWPARAGGSLLTAGSAVLTSLRCWRTSGGSA